ncbi:MAG: CotH kinase family protein [Christensenellaceae bacterium]|jgi:hypothetical protein
MRGKRGFILITIFIVLIVLSSCGVPEAPPIEMEEVSRETNELFGQKNTEQNALAYLDEEFYLQDGFNTHLPLLVMREDASVDFYMEGGSFDLEKLAVPSAFRAGHAALWSEGASPGKPERIKLDYELEIAPEDLSEMGNAIWDTQVYGQWYLLGGMYDKSLLRNYLALTLANEMGSAGYLVRYCEVFSEIEGTMKYQGVYLIAAAQQTTNYHFQRGNYWDEEAVALNTYATEQGLLNEGLYTCSLNKLDDDQYSQLKAGIDKAEQSIYSWDYNAFSEYTKYVDSEKMYDYFLLYELFGNYDSAHLTRYLYNPAESAFWPVASLDFEFSADNAQKRPLDIHSIEMMETPYYTNLVKSTNFIKGLVDRYKQLNQDVLKSSNIDALIDETVQFLGESQIRDWARWEDVYVGADRYLLNADEENEMAADLPALDRNAYSYSQEVNKLKFTLREHGQYIFAGLATLYEEDDLIGDDASYVRNTWMFFIGLAIVIVSIRIVRYKTRG